MDRYGKHDPEVNESSDEKPIDSQLEQAQMLADLPDPDAGKSPEERAAIDKKLMWKVDLWLVPWLSLLYLLSFLDRTNIGNARLAGMEEDLNMEGSDYNLSLTIFFISYAVFEPATNALLKRLTPRIFFTGIIIVWGTIMTLMGLCTNFPGLLAARWFLGIAEAGLFPGVNYYLSCWYKGSEIGVRSAVFFSAAALAGSFGGLLAAAIAKMDGIGGKPGWAWIFIIEGLATVFVGVFCWWMVFDWPENARFLTPEERIRVQRRLIADKQGRTAEDFDKRHIYGAMKDWKTYGYMVIYMGCLGSLKRAFVLGMVVGWARVSRYLTGHGVVLGYQILFLLGGSIFMHFALRISNNNRRAGKMDAKWASMTDEQKWVAGDKRPDFMYTL
ncbi:major facilitator superfamily transporter [Colletotrichum tofieldiae]|nr:major facilitator superfamily transporter [Colletotrichum tofieldiae]